MSNNPSVSVIIPNYNSPVIDKVLDAAPRPSTAATGLHQSSRLPRKSIFTTHTSGKIGNLREHSFSEIWSSPEAEKMRNYISCGKCYCVHSCFMQNNILFTPSTYPSMILYFLKRLLKYIGGSKS